MRRRKEIIVAGLVKSIIDGNKDKMYLYISKLRSVEKDRAFLDLNDIKKLVDIGIRDVSYIVTFIIETRPSLSRERLIELIRMIRYGEEVGWKDVRRLQYRYRKLFTLLLKKGIVCIKRKGVKAQFTFCHNQSF